MPLDPIKAPFADTELCVKCGLCLPHCPTYGKTLDENESPRGRLSLIQAWAEGKLDATPTLLGHVDLCLLCRSCESACPANVPYGRLVDDFRIATASQLTKPLTVKIKSAAVGYALQSQKFQRWTRPMRKVLINTGLMQFLGIAELAAGLPEPFEHDPWPGFHPAMGLESARVALFLGCTAELADAETVSSAIRLLNRLGVSVTVPAGQDCCGGIALHNGDGAGFHRKRQNNLGVFDANEVDAILCLASGCGAVLKEYAEGQGFSAKIKDISNFLAEYPWPSQVLMDALPGKVLVHSPCSLRNVLKSASCPPALLRRIPELQITSLTDAPNCCGAAGTYFLGHPAMARALREDLLDKATDCSPNYIATSNVGCAMHLRAGLRQRGMDQIQVLHPLVLLERQLYV